jgi:hypothetical protein
VHGVVDTSMDLQHTTIHITIHTEGLW